MEQLSITSEAVPRPSSWWGLAERPRFSGSAVDGGSAAGASRSEQADETGMRTNPSANGEYAPATVDQG